MATYKFHVVTFNYEEDKLNHNYLEENLDFFGLRKKVKEICDLGNLVQLTVRLGDNQVVCINRPIGE